MSDRETEEIPCAACSVMFGVEKKVLGRLRENGKTFYCPNGHSNYYNQQPKTKKCGKCGKYRELESIILLHRRTILNQEQTIKNHISQRKKVLDLKTIIKKMESATSRVTRTKLANEAFGTTDWQK